jgi:glycosyltransferase involved in cell wall biosynthesis
MRKKILFVHHTIGMSGASKSLGLLIGEIDLQKYDPYVLLIWKGEVSEYLKGSKAKRIFCPGIFPFHGSTVSGMSLKIRLINLMGCVPTFISAKYIINKINPDVVHLNSTCLFMFAKAIKSIKRNIPVITHIREPIANNKWGRILKKMNNKYIDGYIAINNYDLSLMECPEKRSVVIYNFSDLFNVQNIASKKNYREKTRFLFLGRIRKSNGILEFVQMIKEAFFNDGRCEFIISGFSKKTNKYEKRILDEIRGINNIVALQFSNNIKELIDQIDVIISPFTEPHFSRSVIEGASLGKPALITDVAGQNELIIHGVSGYLYQKDNVQDFKEKVLFFIDDKEKIERMGKNSIEYASKNFEPSLNAKRTYDFIDSFL